MKKKLVVILGVVCAVMSPVISAHAVTCAGPVPPGNVVVNIYTDSVHCSASGPTNNAYDIASYLDKQIGDTMQMCAGFPIPAGWIKVDTYNLPTKCGGGNFNNIVKIKRTSIY